MLIVMTIHDTEDNGRSKYTAKCLQSMEETVDWNKHRLILVNNNSCESTENLLLLAMSKGHLIINNQENLGTARAVNQGLKQRKNGEVCCKTDNDVVWNTKNWADELEKTIIKDKTLGILGLKRKDIWQHVNHENPLYRTHFDGNLELCDDIMGTCTALNPLLLDKIGFFCQCSPYYGGDDVLMSVRSLAAGFRNAFLPHIDIDHIDVGGDAYCEWKKREAGVYLQEMSILCDMYRTHQINYFYDYD